MSIGTYNTTGTTSKPLTREAILQLLHQAGSPGKLDLSHQNLNKIDLSGFDLTGANLFEANLMGANLRGAKLEGVDLRGSTLNLANLEGSNLEGATLFRAKLIGANLHGANLHEADLRRADLSEAKLFGANLGEADLDGANLQEAILSEANLGEAILRGAILDKANLEGTTLHWASLVRASLVGVNLRGADLRAANLRGANLVGANLGGIIIHGANLAGTDLLNAYISEYDKEQLRDKGVIDLDEMVLPTEINSSSILHLRIVDEPLTPYNLAIAFTALTELTTKFWLISKRRFDDLVEYSQTHDVRFANESGSIITRVSYNSPFNFDWKVDLSAPSVAEALVTTLDGIKQRDTRQQKAELENLAKAQKIEEDKQKAEHAQKMAELDRKIKELEFQERQSVFMFKLEQQRAELLERTLEMLNKNRDLGIENAGNVANILLQNADAAARTMLIQLLLPNILQLQEVKGLELALPTPTSN